MTGTVLQGQVKTGDIIEIPSLRVEKKVKSMQMFRKPTQSARQGDRIGICVAQLDSSEIERGIACTPGTMKTAETVLAVLEKVRFYTELVKNKQKFHITIGHQTAVGQVHFFSRPCNPEELKQFIFNKGNLQNYGLQYNFDESIQYDHQDELKGFDPSQEEKKEGEEEKK